MQVQTRQAQTIPVAQRESPPVEVLEGPGFLQVLTLVLWIMCLAIGVIGYWISDRPVLRSAPPAPLLPLQVQMVDVQLTPDEPAPQPAPAPEAVADQSPQPPAPDQQIPPLPEVALPGPAIAFAVPVEGPVSIVQTPRAAPLRAAVARPMAKRLYMGGDWHQPDPAYPPEAQAAGEQGDVLVRFRIGPEGQVAAPMIVQPCQWPLLNRSVLETVRTRWRWKPGELPPGYYEVMIHYHL